MIDSNLVLDTPNLFLPKDKQKKVQEKSLQIEQIKIQITNMSQRPDFLKSLRKAKTAAAPKESPFHTMTNREFEKSSMSIMNSSRMNTSIMDDFSHGFNTFWNKLLAKFNSRSSKSNNILDSIATSEKGKK